MSGLENKRRSSF